MAISQELIDRTLAGIKQRPKIQAQPFQNYMANVEPLLETAHDPSNFLMRMEALEQGAGARHQSFMTMDENAKIKAQLEAQRIRNENLRGRYKGIKGRRPEIVQRRQPQPPSYEGQQPGGGGNLPPGNAGPDTEGGKTIWGSRPEVSDIGKLNPNAPIKTYNWRGHKVQLNSQVAPIFLAFLDALAGTGYDINTLGGYANRPVTGGGRPSNHAFGFAIDVNAAQNPYQSNDGTMQTNMPPRVGALAAKYGLKWGGSWRSVKDPMHFSIAHPQHPDWQ